MIPYPTLYGDYWANTAYWWNLEFWNESVQRAVLYGDAFSGTPSTFPKTALSFDATTGHANVSPSDYIAQAVPETRFHLAGQVKSEYRGVLLVRTEMPWRAQWLTSGLYDDGWTKPHVVGRIRVFAKPGQTTSLKRYLTISVRGPSGSYARPFHVISNASDWRGRAPVAGTSNQIAVCVPAQGFADVRVNTRGFAPIYGDLKSSNTFAYYARSGGVLITAIALADETGPC